MSSLTARNQSLLRPTRELEFFWIKGNDEGHDSLSIFFHMSHHCSKSNKANSPKGHEGSKGTKPTIPSLCL